MKKTILLLAGIFVLITSCNETDEPVNQPDNFVPGRVSVQLHDTVLIDEAFTFINEEDLSIDYISGFYSYSQLPNAQLDYVIGVLSTKAYLRGSADIHDITNRIQVYATLDAPNETIQQDWLETIEALQLIDMHADYKLINVIVPEGTEKRWVEKFNAMPLVKKAQLNEYGDYWSG